MHVLYFHQHFTTRKGAGGTRSYEMAKALLSKGHKVTMVCGSAERSSTGLNSEPNNNVRTGIVDGINIIEYCIPYSNSDSFFSRTITFIKFSLFCIKYALFTDYDLLFATSTPLTVGIPGIVMKVFRKKPFVFEVRDLWPELPREMGVITNPLILSLISLLEYLSYHAADLLIGLSPGIREGIKKRGIEDANIFMIPNGSDIDLFKPNKEKGFLNYSKNDITAVFAGAIGLANGLHQVLDAAELVQEKNDKIKFIFLGAGKLKNLLESEAKNRGLNNCFFHAPISKELLSQELPKANLGLMILDNIPAFFYGTSPNKFFDYIAAGLPVFLNYPGWLEEIVLAHECGSSCKPDDPSDFANKIIKLASDPEKLILAGQSSRALAETKFNRGELANDFVAVLELALKNNQSDEK